jgi:hypothetical protein
MVAEIMKWDNFKENWNRWIFGLVALSLLWLMHFDLIDIGKWKDFCVLVGGAALVIRFFFEKK